MGETSQAPTSTSGGNRFGTFGGVFTPSILTIFGVIMFMRAGFVIGEAGILGALVILVFAKSITFLTSLSVAAVSTNTQVEGGGAYFLISRVMGPEFGGSIGLALFGGQALSVPFYILGFTEAFVATFPPLSPHYRLIALATAAVLFVVTWVGARYAIRVQYLILAILILAIASFLAGGLDRFDLTTFRANLGSGYSEGSGFWVMFAIYFPAVTGIMAGINMSGDLRDPARSIPRGTFAAVLVGALVYAAEIVICGGAFDRGALVSRPFETLKENAIPAGGVLVVAGVFAATLSSAMGSMMGAPRVLQAVSRDGLFRTLGVFSRGASATGEPRRALVLTGVITFAVVSLAGGDGAGFFNAVAAVVAMFFLFTYGMVNIAAFVESFGGNPSFRPRFRYFSWITALFGAVGCLVVAFLIHWPSALAAGGIMFAIYAVLRRRALELAFGDARRGFRFTQLRNGLHVLSRMPMHAKNWRPTMLVLSGNPNRRLQLVTFATWLEGGRGIVTLVEILVGDLERLVDIRQSGFRRLEAFIEENELMAYPEVVVARDMDEALPILLQSQGVGPLKPNLVMVGWSYEVERAVPFAKLLRTVASLGMSLVVYEGKGVPHPGPAPLIDLWWRGRENGSLMLILAHLMRGNAEWAGAKLRVLRVVGDEAGREPAEQALRELIRSARVEAVPKAVVSRQPFAEVLVDHSMAASLVILGLRIPDEGEEETFQKLFAGFLQILPPTLLVHSSGEADLNA